MCIETRDKRKYPYYYNWNGETKIGHKRFILMKMYQLSRFSYSDNSNYINSFFLIEEFLEPTKRFSLFKSISVLRKYELC